MSSSQNILKTGSAMVIGFGLMVVLAAHPSTSGLILFFADLLIWPFDGLQTGGTSEFRLLSAVGGGVMIGWGAMLWMLSGEGMRQAPALSGRIIATSIWIWFTVDSTASVVAGAPLNVAGNLVFLAMFILPLRKLRQEKAA